jgi:hypothetical protein
MLITKINKNEVNCKIVSLHFQIMGSNANNLNVVFWHHRIHSYASIDISQVWCQTYVNPSFNPHDQSVNTSVYTLNQVTYFRLRIIATDSFLYNFSLKLEGIFIR